MNIWKRYKDWFYLAIRYLIGVLIIIWLLNTNLINPAVLDLISVKVTVFAIFFIIVQVFLTGLRIQLLLAKNDIAVGIWSCIFYNSVGIFYSLFLPGGMSGDLTRAYYFTRACPFASKSALFGALFVDRLLGTIAMIMIGLVASTFLMTTLRLQEFILPSWLGFTLIVLGYVLIVRLHHKSDKNKIGFGGRLFRFFEKIDLQGYGFSIISICLILGVMGHLCAVLVICLCSDLMLSGLDFLQIVAVAPIGLLANALPLTPGGLGIGEKGFDVMYRLIGGIQGGNSFLLARVFLFAPAILGGIVVIYLFIKSHSIILGHKQPK